MAREGGKRSRRKGAHRPIACVCFHPAADEPSAAAASNGGRGGVVRERRIPTHLVVTVNGIVGSAANWRFAAKQFLRRYPEDIVVHCSVSNYSRWTFDGVDVMGERLAKEVLSVVAHKPELRKISFVSHSVGGLVARYAIARLYTQSEQKDSSEEIGDYKTCNCETQCLEHKTRGKIAGLEPVNFITFATPHLGSRFHKQIPLLHASQTLEKMAYHISCIAGRTGNHLFLKDHNEGKHPLLIQMVSDNGDLPFMSTLLSFKRHVTYSNVCCDFVVGWKTSSIRRHHELPERKNFMQNERYPHIVYEEKAKAISFGHEKFVETTVSQPMTVAEMEDAMVKGLNRVPWERVDVSFHNSKQWILAHSTIQVCL